MAIEKWLEDVVSIPGGWGLTGQVFIIIFLVLVAELAQRIILNRMHAKAEKTRTPWDDALLGSVRKPLSALIWLVGISLAAEVVARQSDAALFDYIQPTRELGLIAIVTWFVLRFIGRAERTIIQYSHQYDGDVDQTAVDAVAKLLKATVAITAGLVVLQTLGVSISGILAFGGVGGIAVGFAARDMLANFFGSLTIYLDKPFKVGDWVRSPDRQIEGTVEKIGWRSTRIRTFEQRPLYIPNAVFTTIVVENPSRMLNRRISETIGIRYDDYGSVRDIVDAVRQMLEGHEDIDKERTLIVNFVSYGGSSLDIMVYCLTRTIDWVEFHKVKQDVLLKIGDIIESQGAEIAFPTRTLHLASQPPAAAEGDSQ